MKKLATALLLGAFTLGFSQSVDKKIQTIEENNLHIVSAEDVSGGQIVTFGSINYAKPVNENPSNTEKIRVIEENNLQLIGAKQENGRQVLIFGKKYNEPVVVETTTELSTERKLEIIRELNLKLINKYQGNNAQVLVFGK